MPGSYTDGLAVTTSSQFEQIDGVNVVQHKLVFGGRHESGETYIIAGLYRVLVDPSKIESVIAQIATWTRNSPMPACGLDSAKLRGRAARGSRLVVDRLARDERRHEPDAARARAVGRRRRHPC